MSRSDTVSFISKENFPSSLPVSALALLARENQPIDPACPRASRRRRSQTEYGSAASAYSSRRVRPDSSPPKMTHLKSAALGAFRKMDTDYGSEVVKVW